MADIQFTPDAAQPPPINFTPDAAPDTGDPQADEANALAGGTQALAHQVVGGTLGAAGRLAGRVVDVLPPSTTLGTGADWNPAIPRKADVFGNAGASVMAPTTPEGQGVEQALGEAGAAVGRGVASIPGVNTPAGQTLLSTGGEALQDVGLVAGAAGVPRFINDLSTETSTIGRFGQPEAPPKITPGPITAEQLRSGPDRLPAPPTKAPAPSTAAPAPEVAPPVPVPGKPHIRPKIQAPPTEGEPPAAAAAETTSTPAPLSETEAPAPATAAPSMAGALAPPVKDEAEIAAGQPPSTSDQQARLAAVQQLQQDTGATMPNIRKSAVSGDYRETGTDYQLADKLGEPTMKAQLDQETHALQTASQNQIDSTGGVARGTGQGALEQRGGVFDSALQAIGNWFDKNIRQLYQTADQSAQQRPISNFGNLGAILGDHSQFTGVEGRQLHADISQVAQQFGMMGQDGFWKPTTVATAERFRQWLGEQYTPRTGRTIGRVKDALDADVASHGGQGLYDAGRALRYKRDQMLEGPTGIARLMPDKLPDGRLINRPVPLDRIMDHVANLPREQFDHIVNVLHDSSKLGSGELAAGNARALNELRRHMAERLNEAGTSSRDGRWNPYAYHDQLDEYSTKLPAIFSPEGMRRFQTIHDAGNALRLNKNYPGAAKSIMDAGGLRALAASRIASGIEGSLVGWAGPLKGALWDTTVGPSVRKGLERAVGGSPEKRQAARAAARLEPLGAQFPGQRGAVGILNATRPTNDIQRTYEPATGEHIVTSTSGASRGQDWGATGKDIRETRSDTWGPWGKGEGTRRAAALADVAHARGGRLVSDTSVSPGMTKVYASLKHMGYDVKKNPAAELNPNTGNWTLPIGADPRDSVFTVGPKPGPKPVPSLAARFPGQRGGPKFAPKAEAPLAGAPAGDRPNPVARGAAAAYMRSAKMPYQPLTDYRYVSPKVATNVANAYDAMPHDPTNPKVAAAYTAFKAETLAQYKQMMTAGVKVSLDKDYPYRVPRDVQADVRNNNHMSVFPTDQGFGEPGSVPSDHPMLERSPIKMGGQDATYNDLFRATHDYYGHVANGNGFRANGEYNAWRAHRQMYSAAARPAMDSETLGQNSWVNSGPHAQTNAGASQTATVYAEQKAGLLPPKVVRAAETGVSADQHHITNLLTPAERGQLRTDTVSRLMAAFHGSPATEEYAAAALAGSAKRGWYRNSAQAIANVFGPDAPRFSALLSSMSPQVSVETNFRNALHTFVNWDKAGRPTDPATIRQIMEDSSQRSPTNKGNTNVMDAWVGNAVRALTAEDPTNVQLSGPKVHSFYSNLNGNVNEVTNDAWMAAFAKIDPTKLGGTLNKSGPGKSSSYLALSARIRGAAKMLSNMTGETWTPEEVQETVWSWAKTAYKHAEELGDRSIPELVHNGEITDDLIKSTPDFHQLFGTPEHRGFLESSRYAGNAERVASWKGKGAVSADAVKARAAAAQTLRPNLLSAAKRLEAVRQERNSIGNIEVPF